MPYDFSQLLFGATDKGGTVVVGDGKTPTPHLASNPGLMLAPTDLSPEMLRPLASNGYDWNPARSGSGPVSIVVSSADRALYVYRNGIPIGRASIEIRGGKSLGSHVFTMLEGVTEKPSWWAFGRPARKWMRVTSAGRGVDADKLAARLDMNREFATKLYDTVSPGTTVIVTDQPIVRSRGSSAILEN
jgi:hypothetical protein